MKVHTVFLYIYILNIIYIIIQFIISKHKRNLFYFIIYNNLLLKKYESSYSYIILIIYRYTLYYT